MGFRLWGVGFRVSGLGFQAEGLGEMGFRAFFLPWLGVSGFAFQYTRVWVSLRRAPFED